MRKLGAIVLLALLLAAFNPHSAKAFCFNTCVTPPPPPRAVPVVGPWVVGAFGLSVLSVIIRAAVVSHHLHRELTSAEAADAIFMPFTWIIFAQSTGAARDDLITIMDGVKAINKQKDALRNQMNTLQQQSAPIAQPTAPSTQPDRTIKRP